MRWLLGGFLHVRVPGKPALVALASGVGPPLLLCISWREFETWMICDIVCVMIISRKLSCAVIRGSDGPGRE